MLHFLLNNGRVIRGLIFSGAILAGLIIVQGLINPKKAATQLPAGFRTPILALELAETPQEVEDIAGPLLEENSTRAAFRTGIYYDFFFILSFTFFQLFLVSGLAVRRMLPETVWFWTCWLIVLAGLADYFEDYFLLGILNTPSGELSVVHFFDLRLATLVKWLLLAAVSGAIARGLWHYGGKFRRFVAGLFFVSGLGGLATALWRPAVELQSVLMGLGWLLVWARSLPVKNPWWRDEPPTD